MRSCSWACAVTSLAAALVASAVDAATLATNGRTEYAIVVSMRATPTDRFAAEELKTFLEESTGAEFPIVVEPSDFRKTIQIDTAAARRLIGEAAVDALRAEESVYVVDGDAVSIVGAGVNGNAYGVYSFLEREVGCRWFTTMGENLVPRHRMLAIGNKRVSERPRFKYRHIHMFGQNADDKDSNDHLFLFRNRINQVEGNYENVVRSELKGKLVPFLRENRPTCHSFFFYVPPYGKEGFFGKHPEYYSLGTDGKRTPRQLCFSNAELRKVAAERFIAHARKIGGRGFLDFSHQDMGGPLCLCDGCKALAEKYGSNGGPLFDFIYELAPKVKAACPEIIIHFAAYRKEGTQRPPKNASRFPDNVATIFAPLDDDFSKSLAHKNNADTFADLKGWCRLCNVWTWFYPQIYTATRPPFGGLGRTADDLRLSFEAGAVGSYHEHDVGTECGTSFADLQTWLLGQGLRDPDRDWRELRKEFCDFCYGTASDDVIAYEEFLENGRESLAHHLGFHGRADGFFSPHDIASWQDRFDEMERKVGGDALMVQRLREVRLGLDLMTLIRWGEFAAKGLSVPFTPDGIYCRASTAYAAAVRRRFNRQDAVGEARRKFFLEGPGSNMAQRLKTQCALAKLGLESLPDALRQYGAERIAQVFSGSGASDDGMGPTTVRLVAMKDAATGYALAELSPVEQYAKPPFSVGFYDRMNKTTLLSRKIAADEIVPGRFHLYKIGRTRVSSSECQVWIGGSWALRDICWHMHRPPYEGEWDIYVSLKFEGPLYDSPSTLAESAVYYDRSVFVSQGETKGGEPK